MSLYTDPDATDEKKACLALHAANFLENERIDNTHDFRARKAVGIVGGWLEELRLKTPALPPATCPQRQYSRAELLCY